MTTTSIDPRTLMRIKSLELRAKHVVEGFCSGLNRSPYHGFSVEFTEYRQYAPGDDLRYLDWKLLARSDRRYLKRFEDETNLRCHLLVDVSRSMTYGSLDYSKADYARTLAATLGYFLCSQRDAVGVMTFDDVVQEYIPARFQTGQLHRLCVALENQSAAKATNLVTPLESAAEQIRQRGILVLITDLLTDLEPLSVPLGLLKARGHEVVVFQVLDPAEMDFDFDSPRLFQDLETGQEFHVDPDTIREGYLKEFHAHLEQAEKLCGQWGISLHRFRTDDPLENALSEFLRVRMHGKGRAA